VLSQRGLQQSSGVSLPFVNGGMLRASLAPLAASPSQAHPPCLPPGYGILWSSGRGRLKRGASVPVRSSLAGILARFAPHYRQPSAAVVTDSAVLAHIVSRPPGHPGVAECGPLAAAQ
jgi:hypothetical protein